MGKLCKSVLPRLHNGQWQPDGRATVATDFLGDSWGHVDR